MENQIIWMALRNTNAQNNLKPQKATQEALAHGICTDPTKG